MRLVHGAFLLGMAGCAGACGARTGLNAGFALESGAGGSAGSIAASAGAGMGGATTGGAAATGSCANLPATCGPMRDESCCASSVVPGGTFLRANDHRWPATIADFRLDRFEVTVGRFRRFAAVYSQAMTENGAGKNPSNPLDPGWDAASWNALLPLDRAGLETSLSGVAANWTTQATADSENYPINKASWYEAEAFCIWDGGRLPTAREFGYAACGGSQQRRFPWSTPPSDTTIDPSHAVYFRPSEDPTLARALLVGSKSPLGDGRYGQADLAGNLAEWVQDYNDDNAGPRSSVCDNCALLTVHLPTLRNVLGGSYSEDASALSNSLPPDDDGGGGAEWHEPSFGFRCARSP